MHNEIKKNDQQYFPTYHFSDDSKDVALREYDLAAATLASEERIFSISTSILIGSVGLMVAVFREVLFNRDVVSKVNDSGVFPGLFLIFSVIVLSSAAYFADIRRSVVLATRKIVILRRVLGINYGNIELVLPARRIDGANEPFKVHMFHGWLSQKAIPIYCISLISGVIVWIIEPLYSKYNFYIDHELFRILFPSSWVFFVFLFYRLQLLDVYEDIFRIFASLASGVLGQKLVVDFEYVIYRARLSVIDAQRLKVPLPDFHRMLVALEDRGFYSHCGVSFRSILSPVYRFISRGKRSGGSTITQQVVRTLFIEKLSNTFRRKFVEIILAIWFDRNFDKTDIINIYVCSVRYDRGVNGILSSMRYFFPNRDVVDITKPMIYFMLDRVSNISSSLIPGKVESNLLYLIDIELLSVSEAQEVVAIFRDQIASGRVKGSIDRLERIGTKLSSL